MKKTTLIVLLGVFVLFTMFAGSVSLYADTTLSVPEVFQEYSEWCWAGATQGVLSHYGHYPSQCEIANYAWSTTRCCAGGRTFYSKVKGCNKANWFFGTDGSVEGILNNWGLGTSATATTLTWATCVQELDNSHPFVMRFGWTGGGGHFLVGYGYISAGSYLQYMDPWPGEGYTTSLYSYVVSSPEHTWTHSMTTY
ncbi:MAG: hypothetical protein GY765_31535 [bacterium]|nr:hypothetical protein [bacterium]